MMPAPKTPPPINYETLAQSLGLKTQAGFEALRVSIQNVQLLDRKQQDYGPDNIASFGELGLLVRVNDKLQRLINLHKTGKNSPQNESVTDSWLDLSNYGIIAAILRENRWNGLPFVPSSQKDLA